ncbi:transmembrane protein [methanogenic archaeon ISO4-H5]|nr:transmembrane protein [methanogenic archaeon ISO4-H5]
MDPLINTILVILLPLALALFAYKKNLMTVWATVTSFAQAEIIGFCTNIWWVLAFFMFPVMAFIATKWKLKEKMELGLQEGKKGERSVLNLLGVGTIPVVIAIVFFLRPSDLLTVAFLSSIAVSTSDTIASETGIWAKKTYMITTFKQVEPGPNGAVSLYGFGTAFIGTLAFALLGWFFIFNTEPISVPDIRFLIVVAAGMFGNVMDSVLGATLENPGYIGKYTNNASTALMGAVFGALLYSLTV